MTIFLSLPAKNVNDYLVKRSPWNQMTYFIYRHLIKQFPNQVSFIPFKQPINMTDKDILISCLPNPQMTVKPHRTITVDPENFDTNKWKYGKFKKYGLNAKVYKVSQFNYLIKNLFGAVYSTSDVAIEKWNNNHIDVLEKKKFLKRNIKNITLLPHPIDKEFFSNLYNSNLKINKLKMLIYHDGWAKSGEKLIELLKKNKFNPDSFTVTDHVNKTNTNVKNILSKYAYFAHTSYSEGFPYFANEFLCQGLILYGHEEWWDGYGNKILTWTYDPKKKQQNLRHLSKLLNPNFKEQYYELRKQIVQKHLNREDNNFEYYNNKLTNLIKQLM